MTALIVDLVEALEVLEENTTFLSTIGVERSAVILMVGRGISETLDLSSSGFIGVGEILSDIVASLVDCNVLPMDVLDRLYSIVLLVYLSIDEQLQYVINVHGILHCDTPKLIGRNSLIIKLHGRGVIRI